MPDDLKLRADPKCDPIGRSDGGPGVIAVVPTKHTDRTLEACLLSPREQRIRPMIVVEDNYSTDEFRAIAQALVDFSLEAGPERSAKRNRGAAVAVDGEVLRFVGSDMVVDPDVVGQVLTHLAAGYEAVVGPEHTMGSGFVARMGAFERAKYVGVSQVEAALVFTGRAFDALVGFGEALNPGEDRDLSLRMLGVVDTFGRLRTHIWHEGARNGFPADFTRTGCQVTSQSTGLQLCLARHSIRGRVVVVHMPNFGRLWTLLQHRILGSGLVFLKLGEATAVLFVLARHATTAVLVGHSAHVNAIRCATTRLDHDDPTIDLPNPWSGFGHPGALPAVRRCPSRKDKVK